MSTFYSGSATGAKPWVLVTSVDEADDLLFTIGARAMVERLATRDYGRESDDFDHGGTYGKPWSTSDDVQRVDLDGVAYWLVLTPRGTALLFREAVD